MYRLDTCKPVLRDFFIKRAKRMCICKYVIFSIDIFKTLVFDVRKGYKQIIAPGSCKTYCSSKVCLIMYDLLLPPDIKVLK